MSDDTTTSPAPAGRDRRELIKLVAGIVVIMSFIVLAVLAIAASRSSLSFGAPASAQEGEPLPAVPDLGLISTPIAERTAPVLPPPPAIADEAPSTTTSTTVAEPVAPPPLADQDAGKPCAQFGLPAPDKVGGLQSLVRLIPIFGQFSPEAFTMLPAFQPGIDTLGPLFPIFEQLLDQGAPVVDPLVQTVRGLGDAGYALLAPLYAPVRPAVLAGEAQLAAYLQPLVTSLAEAPGSECLVALEGLLASIVPNIGLVPDL